MIQVLYLFFQEFHPLQFNLIIPQKQQQSTKIMMIKIIQEMFNQRRRIRGVGWGGGV